MRRGHGHWLFDATTPVHELAVQQAPPLHELTPPHVTSHAAPEQRTLPAHEVTPVQEIVLVPGPAVTPWMHEDAPEHTTSHDGLAHLTGPEQALTPHFTVQLEPPQVTDEHEPVAPQSMAHELAALQSMAPQPLRPHVIEQGTPGGQVMPPVQAPAAEQSKTHVPALQVPPLHRAEQALASGTGSEESAGASVVASVCPSRTSAWTSAGASGGAESRASSGTEVSSAPPSLTSAEVASSGAALSPVASWAAEPSAEAPPSTSTELRPPVLRPHATPTGAAASAMTQARSQEARGREGRILSMIRLPRAGAVATAACGRAPSAGSRTPSL